PLPDEIICSIYREELYPIPIGVDRIILRYAFIAKQIEKLVSATADRGG
ncbi:unnamed protein product, partial [marine sediment metagenome]